MYQQILSVRACLFSIRARCRAEFGAKDLGEIVVVGDATLYGDFPNGERACGEKSGCRCETAFLDIFGRGR